MTTEKKSTPLHAAKSEASQSVADAHSHADTERVIVDIGKGSRKDVRKLRKGSAGKLMRRLDETVEHLRESGAMAEGAQVVVLVVRQRRRRRAKMLGLG